MPLTSVPADPTEAHALGTVVVLVSQKWIHDMGIFNSRLATCFRKNKVFFSVLETF